MYTSGTYCTLYVIIGVIIGGSIGGSIGVFTEVAKLPSRAYFNMQG